MENKQDPCIGMIIEQAASAGIKLSEKKANEMVAKVFKHGQALAPKFGGDVHAAMTYLAKQGAISAKAKGAALYRIRLLDIATRRTNLEFVKRFDQNKVTAGEMLGSLFDGSERGFEGSKDSIDARFRGTRNMLIGRLGSLLTDSGVYKDFMKNTHWKDVVRENWELTSEGGKPGVTGNPAALKIAQAIHQTNTEAIALMNQSGAFVRMVKGYGMSQSWSRERLVKLSKVNGVPDQTFGRKHFIETLLPLLDHEKTFQGEPANAFLKSVYENLYTSDHTSASSAPDEYTLSSGVAAKVGAERKLHFKDAESQIKAMEIFGEKSHSYSVTHGLEAQSRAVAIMQILGPNAEQNFQWIRRQVMEQIKDRPDADKQAQSIDSFRVSAAKKIALGEVDTISNPTLYKIQKIAQSIVVGSSLGGTSVMALATDPVFQAAKVTRDAFSGLEGLKNYLTFSFGGGGPETRRQLARMGAWADGLLGHNLDRFMGGSAEESRIDRVNRQIFKWQGLNAITDGGKAGTVHTYSAGLAAEAHLAFKELPAEHQRLLSTYNISPGDWEHYRKAVAPVDGIPYLTGDLVEKLGLPDDQTRILQQKLSTMFTDVADTAIPTPTASDRKFTTGGFRAGSLAGTALGLTSMFKSYPIMIANRMAKSEIYGNGAQTFAQGVMGNKFRITGFIAASAIMGYIGMTARDMLSGKTPRSLTKDDGSFDFTVLRDSIARGGVFGIYGDLVLQPWDKGFKDPSSYVAGPVFQKIVDGGAILADKAIEGKDVGLDALKYASSNVPGANMIFVRQILDYTFLWHLQEMLKPGSLAEAEGFLKKRTGQEYYESRRPRDTWQ